MKRALLLSLLMLALSAIVIQEQPTKLSTTQIVDIIPLYPQKYYFTPLIGAVDPSFLVTKSIQYDLTKVLVGAYIEYEPYTIVRIQFIYRTFRLSNDASPYKTHDNWVVDYIYSPPVGATDPAVKGTFNVTWLTEDLSDKVTSIQVGSDPSGIKSIKFNWEHKLPPRPAGDPRKEPQLVNCPNPLSNIFAHQGLGDHLELKSLGWGCTQQDLMVKSK